MMAHGNESDTMNWAGRIGAGLIVGGMFLAAAAVAVGDTGLLVAGAGVLGGGIIVFAGSGERGATFGGGGGDSSGGLSGGSGDSGSGGDSSGGSDSGSSSGGGGCFVAGTLVALGDGTTKPIETVEVGDYVVSRDEATGNTNPQRVSRTFVHQAPATLLLHLMTGEQVETTGEHRFSVPDQGFIGARRLTPGATLNTQRAQRVQITGIEARLRSACVYNLEVENDHTYFVGKAGVWVHNLKESDTGEDPDDSDP